MRGFASDFRYALRTLKRGRISTVIALLSLAIGVGATAAIFSAGYTMLEASGNDSYLPEGLYPQSAITALETIDVKQLVNDCKYQ
jgi:hypothetical protein